MSDNEARWVEEDDGSYYYYYSDGTMAKGWMQDGGSWYYFYSHGKMATGWVKYGDNWYYLHPGGSMGWGKTVNGFDLNYDRDDGKMVNGTGWLKDQATGDCYYYSDGEMTTGWEKCGDYWYYLKDDGKMATGWIDSGNGWYYLYDNGSMAGGRSVNGYLLNNSGKMVTGTGLQYAGGNSYYLKDDKIVTGWLKYGDDDWHYLYDDGSKAWGRTVEGYYLDDNGDWVKSKGWKKEKDNDGNVIWYYVDSKIAVTGWQQIGGKWYYFDEDGKMQTGWIKDNSNWYYLNSNGAMATGRNDIDGNTYYFYSTGRMATGWVKPGNTWYYYYGDGSLAHDRMIGQYYVNVDGEWEPSEDNSSMPENSDISNEQGSSNPIPASDLTYISIDINKYSPDVQKSINECLEGIQKYKDDEEMLEYSLSALDNVLDYANGWGKNIESFKERARGISTGAIQLVGGVTEAGTGAAIFTGASWTGVGIPVGLSGGYMAVDGASNALGGASKIYNAVFEDNEGDTLNFMKAAYKDISPQYGEDIYNLTQVGLGLYTIGKGLAELPSDAVKFVPRAKNIARAQSEGLTTSTVVVDVGSQIVVTTKTESGMILQKTIVDKSKLTGGSVLIGVDVYNANSSKDAIK